MLLEESLLFQKNAFSFYLFFAYLIIFAFYLLPHHHEFFQLHFF